MKAVYVILLFAAFRGLPASSQTTTGKSSTSGACSPSSSGSGNSFIINVKNCGIGAEQGAKIVEMLKKALADSQTRDAKLNQLLELASRPTVQVGGSIIQTGGDCTQNIVAGSGNTNICGPKPLHISPEQGATITQFLKSTGLTGAVTIGYEYGVDQGSIAVLINAFQSAGIPATSNGAMMMGGCDGAMHNNLPGLSIDCIDVNDPLSNAIAQAFVLSKIFPNTVPATPNVFPTKDGKVHLLIRKP
jgi:hypothetical protein